MSPVSDSAEGAPDSQAIAVAQAMGHGLTPEAYLAETMAVLRKAVGKD